MVALTIETGRPPAQEHVDGIARVVRVLREEPEAALTVRQLAQLTYLSPYHFIRVFRQVTGLPPGDFRAALRLATATRLLLTTTRDVTAICASVGYQSTGTFTTRFTQCVGLSPGRLRACASTLDIPRALPSCVVEQRGATVGGVVRGSIAGADAMPGPLFVGLFPAPIPQGHPVAGTLLHAPGPYTLTGVPDGCYYLVAAALPWSASPVAYLLPDDRLRVGRSARPLWVRHGQIHGSGDLTLRPLQPTDPPVVVALPGLLPGRSR